MKTSRILVWDLPLRVFHWLLAISFVGAFLTAESERVRDVHVVLGYTVLGLLAFRLLEFVSLGAVALPFASAYKDVFAFAVVIAIMAWRPTGLIPEKLSERV